MQTKNDSFILISKVLKEQSGEIYFHFQGFLYGYKIREIVSTLKDGVFDGFATRFRDLNPRGNVAEANRKTRDLISNDFADPELALAKVSGKEALKQLSSWLHDEFGRGVSLRNILQEIRPTEVPNEMREVIGAIEHAKPFPSTNP